MTTTKQILRKDLDRRVRHLRYFEGIDRIVDIVDRLISENYPGFDSGTWNAKVGRVFKSLKRIRAEVAAEALLRDGVDEEAVKQEERARYVARLQETLVVAREEMLKADEETTVQTLRSFGKDKDGKDIEQARQVQRRKGPNVRRPRWAEIYRETARALAAVSGIEVEPIAASQYADPPLRPRGVIIIPYDEERELAAAAAVKADADDGPAN